MRIWVTRTQPQAGVTAERLRRLGHEPIIQPVLEVRPISGVSIDLAGAAALAFTSQNGVAAFAALSARRDLPVFVTGEGTARAAREAGFGQVESADGDVEALAGLIASRRPSGEVIWPGAAEPAGDLCGLLDQAGVTARLVPVYETAPAGPAEPPKGARGVLIHSPRAARVVAERLSAQAAAAMKLFAISAAAAGPLEKLGFSSTALAAEPSEDVLLALLD